MFKNYFILSNLLIFIILIFNNQVKMGSFNQSLDKIFKLVAFSDLKFTTVRQKSNKLKTLFELF